MKAEEFVKHLQAAMPKRETLETYGLDEQEIQDIQGTFIAQERSTAATAGQSEIERMLNKFDCSLLEIGLIRLQAQVASHPEGLVFGFCEADPLVVRYDDRIVMCDSIAPNAPHLMCASDAEHFLDALAVFIDVRATKGNWMGRVEEAAKVCANAAGGREYREFYRLLCSFLRE